MTFTPREEENGYYRATTVWFFVHYAVKLCYSIQRIISPLQYSIKIILDSQRVLKEFSKWVTRCSKGGDWCESHWVGHKMFWLISKHLIMLSRKSPDVGTFSEASSYDGRLIGKANVWNWPRLPFPLKIPCERFFLVESFRVGSHQRRRGSRSCLFRALNISIGTGLSNLQRVSRKQNSRIFLRFNLMLRFEETQDLFDRVESIHISSFYGRYGAGRTIDTYTLLPGEEIEIPNRSCNKRFWRDIKGSEKNSIAPSMSQRMTLNNTIYWRQAIKASSLSAK